MLDEAKFWEVTKYLLDLDHKASFDDICSDLKLTKAQLNSFINFLKEVDYDFELEKTERGMALAPQEEKAKIQIEFTLFEWLQFQAHFPALASCKEKPYHSEIKKKLAKVENENSNHDLFEPAMALEEILESQKISQVPSLGQPYNEIVSFIEESILEQDILNIQIENKNLILSPRKIVYLDGSLNLIGEDTNDKCLVHLNISEIVQVYEENSKQWESIYSQIEVDDFIASIRAISENEVRLVLKVYGRENFDQSIPHHHLGNPCMFTNPEGDFIWAASIEPSQAIFDWLSSLGTDIEILDPLDFKKEYLSYCEHKLKKLA